MQQALQEFKDDYNEQWLIQRLTKPVQARRNGQNSSRRISFMSVSITLGRYNAGPSPTACFDRMEWPVLAFWSL